jgi:hypothetical protein
MKAKSRITALFEFSPNGNLKAIFLNAETEHDEAILLSGLSNLLREEKMGFVRRLFEMVTNGK